MPAGQVIRLYRSAIIILAGVMVATMGIVLTPAPNAQLSDFDRATEIIRKVEVIRHDRGSSDYFDLAVSTESERHYYLRQPEPEDIKRYAAALPVNHQVTIHYRSDLEGKRIFDIREGAAVYVPFAELIEGEGGKRTIILIAGAGLSLLGVLAMAYEIKTRQE